MAEGREKRLQFCRWVEVGPRGMNAFCILICSANVELSGYTNSTLNQATIGYHWSYEPDCGIWVTGLRTNSAADVAVAAQLYQSFRPAANNEDDPESFVLPCLGGWLVDTSIALMHIEHIVGAINYNPGNDDDTPGWLKALVVPIGRIYGTQQAVIMDARNWTDDAQSMDSGCDFPKIRKLGTNTVLHASTKRTREWVGGSKIRGGCCLASLKRRIFCCTYPMEDKRLVASQSVSQS